MGRWFATLAIVLGMLAGSVTATFAQDATPSPRPAGGAVPVYGTDGREEATVEVTAVVDPFEDYDSFSAPERGFHWVMATVELTATGDRAVEANSFGFLVVDTDGFAYYPSFVSRPAEATEALPDFMGGTIEPGQSMSGALFFQLLDGTEPGLVVYQPAFDRMVTVADLRDAPVEQGDEVAFIASDGSPAGTVVVSNLILPFEEYESGSAPQRGFDYAAIEVTVTNDGSKPIEADSFDFYVVDAEGFSYSSTSLFVSEPDPAAVPMFESTGELAPGDSVTGLIVFQVLAGTTPGFVYYAPGSDRHIRVAEYAGGQVPAPGDTPPALPTRPSIGVDETPAADDTPAAGSANCEGALEWGEATLANVDTWTASLGALGDVFSGGKVDPEAARDAAEASRDAADAQRDLDTPEIAAEANEAVASLFEATADALDEVADAGDSGDAAAQAEAVEAVINAVTGPEAQGLQDLLDNLAEECPELVILT